MRKLKNIVILTVLMLFVIINIFGNYVYAENETSNQTNNEQTTDNTGGNNGNTNSETSQNDKTGNETNPTSEETTKATENNKVENNSNSNSKPKTTTTTQKTNNNTQATNTTSSQVNNDSNANLVSLGIRPYDFKGFISSKMEYSVEVPEETSEVEVYAKAESATAKVKGTGKIKLNKGKNKVEVEVTAKDGNMNTYIINIMRGEEDRIIDPTQGLKSLKVKDLELSPSFSTGVYEYKLKYKGDADKLEIDAEPTDSTYKVEIVGNEELKDGENIVTIIVSDKEGENVATYQISIYKNVIDQDDINNERNNFKKEILIGAGITLGIVFLIIIVAVIKHIISKRRDYYYDDEDYVDDEYEDDFENNEELPKAFASKKEDENTINEEQTDDVEVFDQDVKEEIENIIKEYNKDKSNEGKSSGEIIIEDKDNLRKQYLDGFDSEYEEYDDQRPKRQGRKGKRFK